MRKLTRRRCEVRYATCVGPDVHVVDRYHFRCFRCCKKRNESETKTVTSPVAVVN